jgi:hypothetical protein
VFAKLVAETLSGPRSSQNTNAVTRFPGKVYAGAADLSTVTTDAASITTGNIAAGRITNALAAGLSDMTISPSLVHAGTAATYSKLEGLAGAALLRSLNPYVYLDDRSSGEGNWFILVDADDLYFTVDSDAPLNGEAMRIKGSGNVGIRTNAPATLLHLAGTNAVLTIENKGTTNDPAARATAAALWTVGGELKAMDGSGNVATLTPDTVPDESRARKSSVYNVYTGKGHTIDLVALADAVETLTGRKDIITEFAVAPVDWDAEQSAAVAKSQAKIAAWMSDTNAPEVKGPKPKLETAKPKPAWLVDALARSGGSQR